MGKAIFVASKLLKETEKELKLHGATFYDGEEPITEEQLINAAADSEAIICPLQSPITKRVLESGKRLKIIANVGAGFDNIDIETAKKRGIAVTNTPGVSTDATAELTFGLIIDVMRRISEGDRLMRSKPSEFKGWQPTFFLGQQLSGKTIGIIGLGQIGQAVARRAKAFGMEVIYSGHSPKKEAAALGAHFVSQKELIETSDVVSIHAAYSKELKHTFTSETFQSMKKNAFLVNAARGPIIEEKALIEALENGEIRGAALDVYEYEPQFSTELKKFDSVVLTPHIGNATIEARLKMGEMAMQNALAVLDGKDPLNPVY